MGESRDMSRIYMRYKGYEMSQCNGSVNKASALKFAIGKIVFITDFFTAVYHSQDTQICLNKKFDRDSSSEVHKMLGCLK